MRSSQTYFGPDHKLAKCSWAHCLQPWLYVFIKTFFSHKALTQVELYTVGLWQHNHRHSQAMFWKYCAILIVFIRWYTSAVTGPALPSSQQHLRNWSKFVENYTYFYRKRICNVFCIRWIGVTFRGCICSCIAYTWSGKVMFYTCSFVCAGVSVSVCMDTWKSYSCVVSVGLLWILHLSAVYLNNRNHSKLKYKEVEKFFHVFFRDPWSSELVGFQMSRNEEILQLSVSETVCVVGMIKITSVLSHCISLFYCIHYFGIFAWDVL